MRKFYQSLLATLVVLFTCSSSSAQNAFFNDAAEGSIKLAANVKREIVPRQYRALSLDNRAMKSFLWSLPREQDMLHRRNEAPVLELPTPDGRTAKFRVWESSIMEPALGAKFPEMRTFAGQGIDDPYATIRFDYNPYFGFHAQVLSVASGTYYIDPYAKNDIEHYIGYYKKDNFRNAPFNCETIDDLTGGGNTSNIVPVGNCRGTQLYTYRLALACTGEYAVAVCSPNPATIAATAAAMLTTVNRVDGVYEVETSIRMVLVANNNDLIYLNGATDPYTNNNGVTMLGQNQANVDAIIGSANYDIGHVVSTGGGGVATLRSPCNASTKARGVTGLTNPVGDAFDIDYVAHEMGHQWGGNHTFNSSTGSCSGGNRNAGTAYEVGSGTTIQAYAGICGSDNTQPNSDPHFHTVSFDEISVFVENGGAACRVATPTGNTLPQISSMSNNGVSIPVGTPFTLIATATDADGDPLSYNWEEWDLGPSTTWNGGNANTTSPLFKSRIPKTSGSRTFPDMAVILANYPAAPPAAMGGLKGETLPTVARAMKFRLTVRDNRAGGGGVVTGGDGCQTGYTTTFQVNTVGTAPFTVTIPNGGESYPGGTAQTITWNNAGTNAAPVNATDVRILLSTDNGLTYPTVLSASTPNDGSELLVIPAVTPTTIARVKIEAIGNIFFDISNNVFSITAAVASFDFTSPAPTTIACAGPNTATVNLGTTVIGTFTTPINLTASGNPAGTTVSFVTNPLTPGNSTDVILTGTSTLAAGTYTVTVTGTAGAIVKTRVISFIVSPGAAPVITSQPANQVVCAGTDANFTVVATGASSYQWQVSTDGGVSFNNIPVATTTAYTVTAPTIAQNNNRYRVIISSQCGSVTSAAATLTVNAAPAITAQPQNTTVCAGTNASFSVTATGAGLTYQWQLSTDGGTIYNNIPAANAATYTVTGVTTGMNNYRYRVIVTGSCTPAVTSNAGILLVGDAAAITAQPVNTTVCAGSNASFSVTATGSSLTYQWQVSTDGGASFTDIPAATAATLNLAAVTIGMNNNQYRVRVFSCTPTGITSAAATLTVNAPLNISTQPTDVVICSGNNASFTVAATGTGLAYQWQVSTNGGGTWTNAPSTTNTLNLPAVTAGMSGNQYRVVLTGACGTLNSNAATLTVNSPVTITAQPVDVAVCLPGNASFSVTATGTALSHQWQVSTNGGTTWSDLAGQNAATLNLTGLTVAMNGYQYRDLLNGTCTSNLASAAATLTVNAPVSITSQPVDISACVGENVAFTVTATGSTISYQWQVRRNNNPFTNVPNAGFYSGATTNTLNIASVRETLDGYEYRVIVSGVPCGAVISDTALLTVNPQPTVVLTLASYSNITPYTSTQVYATVSPAGNYIYQWKKDGQVIPGVTGSVIPLTVDDFGEYEVSVINQATLCGATSNKVTLTNAASDNVFIYPNPSMGQFQVRYYNAGSPSNRTLNVYDSKGSRVYSKSFPINSTYSAMDVDLRHAAGGVYMVEIIDVAGKRLATSRVVIQ